jgi:hypothetical protein
LTSSILLEIKQEVRKGEEEWGDGRSGRMGGEFEESKNEMKMEKTKRRYKKVLVEISSHSSHPPILRLITRKIRLLGGHGICLPLDGRVDLPPFLRGLVSS